MAIVTNLGNSAQVVDGSFCTHNRVNAGEPNGSIVPAYAGEIILDTTNNAYWRAMGVANNTWIALTPPNKPCESHRWHPV